MTDINKLITENINVWTNASFKRNSTGRGSSKKINLIGIKKLRELILDLAVRGKLVSQNDNHEPASIALEKIAKEKEQLKHDSKIKHKKSLTSHRNSETPFELPKGWEWVKFGDICEIERGGSPRPIKSFITTDEDGLNWIKIGDTDIGGKYITGTAEKIIKEGLNKTRVVYPGDFLLTNSMSFGRPYITKIQGCIHDGWLRISPPSLLDKDYLYSLLSSPFIVKAFKKSASGAVVMNLNADKVRDIIVAVPPIEEQHSIATKVNELMGVCDQLEQQTEAELDAHKLLVEVLLSTLTSSKNAQEFEQNWLRLAEHFDLLFITENSIEQLKQTILQLAVMGKLVPQDSNDEPAAKLLDRVTAEKALLIKNKVITKEKSLPDLTNEEKPFDLPKGWALARVGNLVSKLGSGSTPRGGKSAYVDSGVPFLRSQNIWNYGIKTEDIAYIPEDTHNNMSKTKVFPNDVLLNITGASLGRATIFPAELKEANVSQHVTIIRLIEKEMSEFILLGIHSPMIQRLVWDRQVGVAIEGLSKKVLELFEFPIPPIAEQQRIIEKVKELMVLCEKAKIGIEQANKTKVQLANTIVDKALN